MATLPPTVKLNGFSSASFVANDNGPLNVPSALAWSCTTNVAVAPGLIAVVEKLDSTANPPGTEIGSTSVRSCVPTLRTVNVLLTGVPGPVVPKATLPLLSVISTDPSQSWISGARTGSPIRSIRIASAITYWLAPTSVNWTINVLPVIV